MSSSKQNAVLMSDSGGNLGTSMNSTVIVVARQPDTSAKPQPVSEKQYQ